MASTSAPSAWPWERLGSNSIRQDTRNEVGIAVLLVLGDLHVPEVNDKELS